MTLLEPSIRSTKWVTSLTKCSLVSVVSWFCPQPTCNVFVTRGWRSINCYLKLEESQVSSLQQIPVSACSQSVLVSQLQLWPWKQAEHLPLQFIPSQLKQPWTPVCSYTKDNSLWHTHREIMCGVCVCIRRGSYFFSAGLLSPVGSYKGYKVHQLILSFSLKVHMVIEHYRSVL